MLTVAETAALLRSFDKVLILTHVRPDGDTVGCAAALCAGLRALGKTAYLLAGEKPGPEKLKKAESLGVKIIDESEFRELIGENLQQEEIANSLFEEPSLF